MQKWVTRVSTRGFCQLRKSCPAGTKVSLCVKSRKVDRGRPSTTVSPSRRSPSSKAISRWQGARKPYSNGVCRMTWTVSTCKPDQAAEWRLTISDGEMSTTKAKIFSKIGKETPIFMRFSTVAGERGAADAERDIRGFAMKFYTEEGNWDIVGNNTPVFFFRDPLRFADLNHAIKRDPRT